MITRLQTWDNAMHNSPRKNAEFKVQFALTNLRYVLGDSSPNAEKIEQMQKQLAEAEAELAEINAKSIGITP